MVTVSSGAHTMGRIDFDDLGGERSYSGMRAYSQSKLANILFTYELARRLGAGGVTANALHPGMVRTGFGAEDAGTLQRLFTPLMRPFMKSPTQGAATSIHLASSPELEGVTGCYFAGGRRKRVLQAQLRRGHGETTLAGERGPRGHRRDRLIGAGAAARHPRRARDAETALRLVPRGATVESHTAMARWRRDR